MTYLESVNYCYCVYVCLSLNCLCIYFVFLLIIALSCKSIHYNDSRMKNTDVQTTSESVNVNFFFNNETKYVEVLREMALISE